MDVASSGKVATPRLIVYPGIGILVSILIRSAFFSSMAQSFGKPDRPGFRCVGQDDRKLFTAIARRDIRSRTLSRSRSATSRSRTSPAGCPHLSLYSLNESRSRMISDNGWW